MSTTKNRLLALVAIAGIVGACSGSATTAPASAAPASAAPASAAPASAAPASAAPASAAPASVAPSPDGTLPAPETAKIRIGVSALNEPASFRAILAKLDGLYAKYGLDAEVIGFEGDGKTLQALQAGQLEFLVGAVGPAISTQGTDTPIVAIGMGRTTVPDALWCKDPIKVAADVVGKTIAISTYGGTSHGSSLLALKGLGLTSDQVTITQVGGESARVAAFKAGSIDCIVASRDLGSVLEPMGAISVIDLQAAAVPFGNSSLSVRKDWLVKNPNTALVASAAMVEAQNTIWTNTPDAIKKFAEFTGMAAADADAYMTAFLGNGNRGMMFTDDALLVPRDTLASVQPDLANVDLAACSDHTVLQRLYDLGFYAKIGAPDPTKK